MTRYTNLKSALVWSLGSKVFIEQEEKLLQLSDFQFLKALKVGSLYRLKRLKSTFPYKLLYFSLLKRNAACLLPKPLIVNQLYVKKLNTSMLLDKKW